MDAIGVDEHLQMVNELVAILGSNDSEIIDYQSMPKTALAMRRDQDGLQQEIKDTIQALSQDLGAKQEELANSQDKITAELKMLTDQYQDLQEINTEVSQQIANLRSNLEEMKQKAEDLALKRTKTKEENTQDLVTLKYKVNLYSLVSNIRWDYTAAEDNIAGYVANKNKVVPFQMSTKSNSRCFIVNHLWELMES